MIKADLHKFVILRANFKFCSRSDLSTQRYARKKLTQKFNFRYRKNHIINKIIKHEGIPISESENNSSAKASSTNVVNEQASGKGIV